MSTYRSHTNGSQIMPDVDAFIARLSDPTMGYPSFLDSGESIYVARAPGRLDVMGGIADYSGATVCELPMAEAAIVAWQWRQDSLFRVRTSCSSSDLAHEVRVSLKELIPEYPPVEYSAVQARLTESKNQAWAAYILGGVVVVAGELGVRCPRGANILVDSSVPVGRGLASSAAIEVATLRALTAALGITIDGYDLALLGQIVENRVVGAPCGLMDQLTSALGQADHLLRIRCQGRGTPTTTEIPPELHFIGMDSGIGHAVAGASYRDVRVAAFMGYRIIADDLGLEAEPVDDTHVRIDDPVYQGYLANIPPSIFRARYLNLLSKRMAGAEFLARYGGTTDYVTQVDPTRYYPIRAATAHPVEEEHRVKLFLELLESASRDEQLILLGELMLQSHQSYSLCGLGCESTDALVEAVRTAGPSSGLYGAKITGGGSGGTVAVLALGEKGLAAAEALAAEYARKRGMRAPVFRGSSPGAVAVDVVTAGLNPEGRHKI